MRICSVDLILEPLSKGLSQEEGNHCVDLTFYYDENIGLRAHEDVTYMQAYKTPYSKNIFREERSY
ncbi:MAG: hypothetical protein QXM00_12400 [Candidatus Bathyarchaeia archaeon]